MEIVSQQPGVDPWRPLTFGLLASALSLAVAWVFDSAGVAAPTHAAGFVTTSDWLGNGLLAPVLESALLVAVIDRALRTKHWRVIRAVGLSAVFAAAHLIFRARWWFFVPLFLSFLLYAAYVDLRRAQHAPSVVCWLEASLMHAAHNLALMLVASSATGDNT